MRFLFECWNNIFRSREYKIRVTEQFFGQKKKNDTTIVSQPFVE